MEHQPVRSSHVRSIGYDPETKTLEVTFHTTGQTYVYEGVEPHTHRRILAAKSIGSALHEHVISRGRGKKL